MRALFIDYFLLATFLAFFGFTDNLMHILSFNLQNSTQVFLYSALASQVISNVPSALLFAEFTSDWRALLWGVSVGGYGTLISSLANLISYHLYKAYCNDSKSYLLRFHFYNFLVFLMGILVYFIFVMNHLSIPKFCPNVLEMRGQDEGFNKAQPPLLPPPDIPRCPLELLCTHCSPLKSLSTHFHSSLSALLFHLHTKP